MAPACPDREVDPHENVLNQVRSLDNERHCAWPCLFVNQFHDAEAGNILPEKGAIGGEPAPPPPLLVFQQDKILQMST